MNKVFKALSDPTRRRVLELLRNGPRTAGELSEAFPVSKPTMSAHFAVLHEAGLVEAERHGRAIVYRLKLSVLEEALLGFAEVFGLDVRPAGAGKAARKATLKKRRSLRVATNPQGG